MPSLIEIDKKIAPTLFGDDEDKFAWYEDFVEDYWLDILKNPEHFQDIVEAMIAIFSTPKESMLEQSSNDMIVHYWFLLTKDNDDLFDITQTDDWYKLQKISLYLLLKALTYQQNNSSQFTVYDEHTKNYLQSRLNDFPEQIQETKTFILQEILLIKPEEPKVEDKPKKAVKKAKHSAKSTQHLSMEEQVALILDDVQEIIEENKTINAELDDLKTKFDELVIERDSLHSENESLQEKVKHLENDVSRLQSEIISRFYKLPV